MNDIQIKALERIVSIRKNMEKFLAISIELLSIDQAIVDGKTNPLSFGDHPKFINSGTSINDESLAIEKSHKEQMEKV